MHPPLILRLGLSILLARPGLASPRAVTWVLMGDGRSLQAVVAGGDDRGPTHRLPVRCTALRARGDRLYLTTAEPAGRLLILDAHSGRIQRSIRVGHSPHDCLLSPDGRRAYTADRFDHAVSIVDLERGTRRRVPVLREPVALALSADGGRLFVANLLPEVRPPLDEEHPMIAAAISVIDTARGRVMAGIPLPNGSHSLRALALSPDGRTLVVAHILAHYTVPTWTLCGGAMNRNVLSLIDTDRLAWQATVPLDDPQQGAANPWAVAFSANGRQLYVTHAGTHELSLIDWPALQGRLAAWPAPTGGFEPGDLHFLAGIRRRLPLPVRGPRRLVVAGPHLVVPGTYAADLTVVDPATGHCRRIAAAKSPVPPPARRGDALFHDATRCLEQWQSCATCHPDGGSDALYWDLPNDGLGNTKNTKSLVLAVQTPPVMWRGVRRDAAAGIAAGIGHIQLAVPVARDVAAIAAFLRDLPVVPSPALDANRPTLPPGAADPACVKCHRPDGVPRGRLRAAARRGKVLFEGRAGCVACHPHPTFTTGRQVDAGLGNGIAYDIPSLVGVWRSAPYLHEGQALTLRAAIIDFNGAQRRGHTADLTETEIADLLAYVRSL